VKQVAGDDPGGLLSEERPPRRGRPSRGRIGFWAGLRRQSEPALVTTQGGATGAAVEVNSQRETFMVMLTA
jgi:hypothetical protein